MSHRFTMKIVMAGRVQAGFPSPAEEENADLISIDEWLIDDPNSTFMITMRDDSMKEAGILAGDTVLLTRGRQPKNFDIVVATVDDDWTIRYFYRQGPRTTLLPANKQYFPLTPCYELRVEGVVFGVIRKIAR